MRFCTYGDPAAPTVLLIHGMLTPVTAFEPIIHSLSSAYYVIAPVLDGHDGDPAGDFISAEQQAHAIEAYLLSCDCRKLYAVCGFSLGGVIAFELWKRQVVSMRHLVMDGAPLAGCPAVLTAIMTSSYRRIVKRTRRRDAKTRKAFASDFLPDSLWEDYTVIADTISDSSLCAILKTTGTHRLRTPLPDTDTAVWYCHGTAGNELLSKRTAALLKKRLLAAHVLVFEGETHCHKAIRCPDEWVQVVGERIFTDGN